MKVIYFKAENKQCDFCGIPHEIDGSVKEFHLTSGEQMGLIVAHMITMCDDCKKEMKEGL